MIRYRLSPQLEPMDRLRIASWGGRHLTSSLGYLDHRLLCPRYSRKEQMVLDVAWGEEL